MSSSLTTELTANGAIRPAMAGLLGAGYLYWRNGYQIFDVTNAGLMAGSVFVGNMFGNVVFKRIGLQSSNTGLKSFEHMITAPLIAGGVYAASYKMLNKSDTTPIYKLASLVAVVDVVSEKLSTPLSQMMQPDAIDEF
jgi:hypothetical protein